MTTVSGNNFLDKLGAEKLSVLMRELGKCSCWESAHRNKGPGIEEIFGFFLFGRFFKEQQSQSKIKEDASGKTSR